MSNAELLGPWLRRFLLEHLITERNLSPNSQRSYRDTLILLLPFMLQLLRKPIERFTVIDLSAQVVRAFLMNIENERKCGISTRNQRLCAIRSLARFIAIHSPEHIPWSAQVLAIATKKHARRLISYLEKPEMEAILAAPDLQSAQGRRDYALLLFLYNSGLFNAIVVVVRCHYRSKTLSRLRVRYDFRAGVPVLLPDSIATSSRSEFPLVIVP